MNEEKSGFVLVVICGKKCFMRELISAALPFVGLGIMLAIICVYSDRKGETKNDNK